MPSTTLKSRFGEPDSPRLLCQHPRRFLSITRAGFGADSGRRLSGATARDLGRAAATGTLETAGSRGGREGHAAHLPGRHLARVADVRVPGVRDGEHGRVLAEEDRRLEALVLGAPEAGRQRDVADLVELVRGDVVVGPVEDVT